MESGTVLRSILRTSLLLLLASPAFSQSPGGITNGLRVWLRADAGTSTTTNGAAITSWQEQSGNNRTHNQATAAAQPLFIGAGGTFLINYNPAVRFDGNDGMSVPGYLTTAEAYHVFSVSRINGAGASAWQALYSFTQDVNHADWFDQRISCRTGAAEKTNTSLSVRFGISSCLMPKTGNQRVIWNGGPQSFGNNGYTINAANYWIGTDFNTDYFAGDIQEMIIYAGAAGADMTANEIERIQSYLAIKYGISLSTTGQPNYTASDNTTQFWTGATNAGYQNNIFGLGRDDNSSLLQKQAFSMGDSTISVFLGASLAGLNSANAGSIAANNSFLMLGDNNLVDFTAYSQPSGTAFSNGPTMTAMNYRTNRVWKAQATTQTSWTVGIQSNRYPNANYVLVSSSASFAPASTRIYPITAGTAANVTIANGEFVAIGALVVAPGGVVEQLMLWTKSDDAGTTPSASWKDHSLRANPVEAVGTIALSAANATHNYHPYYSGFSAANNFYDPTSSINPITGRTNTPMSIFTAVRPTALTDGRIVGIDDEVTNAAEPGLSLDDGNTRFYMFTGSPQQYTLTNPVTANRSSVITVVADQALNGGVGQVIVSKDGQSSTTNRTSAGTPFNMIGQRLRIGYGSYDINAAFPGDIMEVAWYNRGLTTDEASRVSSYLALKNGVTLGTAAAPVNYINTASSIMWTGDFTFQNNVAGIARDDAQGLNQKQSNSVNTNTNGQVIISLGAVAASNAANANTFALDNRYLIWGDNGVTTSLSAASTAFLFDGSPANLRMNRIWKVVNTGVLQDVTITVPQATIGTTGDALVSLCQKLKLLVASDAGFTTIVSATNNLVLSGANYVCTFRFPAGTSYFTFGRIESGAEGLAFLPTATTPAASYSTCEEQGWRFWYADGTQGSNNGTQKIFAINRNGNGTASTLNNFTGQVNYQATPYEITNGQSTTRIMGRTLTITDPSSGTYTTNGGMQVRFYLDSTEVLAAILSGAISSKWFKHQGSHTSLLSSQNSTTIANTSFFTNLPVGKEDGVSYIEFSNINSFSTFGFASNAGLADPLPVTIYAFRGRLDNNAPNTSILDWQVGVEDQVANYEVQRSDNGTSFATIGTVAALGRTSYSYRDNDLKTGNNYYRLKVVDRDGRYEYSSMVLLKYSKGGTVITVFPSFVTTGQNIQVNLDGFRKGAKLNIFNSSGLEIFNGNLSNGLNTLSRVPFNSAGLFMLKITNQETGEVSSEKIMVNR